MLKCGIVFGPEGGGVIFGRFQSEGGGRAAGSPVESGGKTPCPGLNLI